MDSILKSDDFHKNQFSGWNHRGVYILSREKILKTKVKRKLSPTAHRRMRMDYHRYEKITKFGGIYTQIRIDYSHFVSHSKSLF